MRTSLSSAGVSSRTLMGYPSCLRITFSPSPFHYIMAKIVPIVQLAAHAKSSTLYGRLYGHMSKFFRFHGLLLFCIIMGLYCELHNDQTGITAKIRTYYVSVRANVIMLRSIVIFGHCSEARNYISHPSSEKIKAFSDILYYALSGRPHLSHCSQFLWCCHSKRSPCSGEFSCCSLIKHSPWTVCFLLVMWKNLCVFMSHNLAKFQWTFHFQILYARQKNFRQKC